MAENEIPVDGENQVASPITQTPQIASDAHFGNFEILIRPLEPKVRSVYNRFVENKEQQDESENFKSDEDFETESKDCRQLQKFAILALGKTNCLEKNPVHNHIFKSARQELADFLPTCTTSIINIKNGVHDLFEDFSNEKEKEDDWKN